MTPEETKSILEFANLIPKPIHFQSNNPQVFISSFIGAVKEANHLIKKEEKPVKISLSDWEPNSNIHVGPTNKFFIGLGFTKPEANKKLMEDLNDSLRKSEIRQFLEDKDIIKKGFSLMISRPGNKQHDLIEVIEAFIKEKGYKKA